MDYREGKMIAKTTTPRLTRPRCQANNPCKALTTSIYMHVKHLYEDGIVLDLLSIALLVFWVHFVRNSVVKSQRTDVLGTPPINGSSIGCKVYENSVFKLTR